MSRVRAIPDTVSARAESGSAVAARPGVHPVVRSSCQFDAQTAECGRSGISRTHAAAVCVACSLQGYLRMLHDHPLENGGASPFSACGGADRTPSAMPRTPREGAERDRAAVVSTPSRMSSSCCHRHSRVVASESHRASERARTCRGLRGRSSKVDLMHSAGWRAVG